MSPCVAPPCQRDSLPLVGGSRRRWRRDGGLARFLGRPPVIPYLSYQYADDLGHRDGQERPWDAQQLPAHEQRDQDDQPVELYGLAVDQRLEQVALHLLVDQHENEKHHGLPRLDEQPHDHQERPAQRRAHQRHEVQDRHQERQRGGVGHAEYQQHDEGGDAADQADGEITGYVAAHCPRRLPQDAPYEGSVPPCEEPHRRVDVPVAPQYQKEGERKDGRQRGEEGGGAYGYLPGGREEIPYHLPELLPQVGEFGVEALHEPTEAVLLEEPLD